MLVTRREKYDISVQVERGGLRISKTKPSDPQAIESRLFELPGPFQQATPDQVHCLPLQQREKAVIGVTMGLETGGLLVVIQDPADPTYIYQTTFHLASLSWGRVDHLKLFEGREQEDQHEPCGSYLS